MPLRALLTALTLLTRVPVRVPGLVGGPELCAAVAFYPVVGALVGAAVAGVALLADGVWPAPLPALLALATGLVLTGALHEDGLADCADALGGRDPETRLRILRDPRLGSFGVLALTLGLGLRAGALSAVDRGALLPLAVAVHGLSRAGMALLLATEGRARGDGLAALMPREAVRRPAIAAGFLGIACAAPLGWGAPGPWILGLCALALLIPAAVGRWARSRLGGVTGDALGAAQQLSELGLWLAGAALLPA